MFIETIIYSVFIHKTYYRHIKPLHTTTTTINLYKHSMVFLSSYHNIHNFLRKFNRKRRRKKDISKLTDRQIQEKKNSVFIKENISDIINDVVCQF